MTKLEQVARVICDYPMGPNDFNSCCSEPMGKKRCQVKARAVVEALRGADDGLVLWQAAIDAILNDNAP